MQQGYPQSSVVASMKDDKKNACLEAAGAPKGVIERDVATEPLSDKVQQPNPEPRPSHTVKEGQPDEELSPAFKPRRQESQPCAEPSPLIKPAPGASDEVPAMALAPSAESPAESAESEPGSEPGLAANATIPAALLSTNHAGLRFRKSCFFDATLRWGVKSFISYNHMLLPQVYSSVEDEYESLRKDVCLWDVAVERQIEVSGEDAVQLIELLTPRILSSMKTGEARYAIMTDDEGMVLNDPVVLKIAEDRFWFSIADSDMLFWIKGLALGRGLKAKVSEVDVSPLAVQGPKSLALMKDLFGDEVEDINSQRKVKMEDLKYYNFVDNVHLDGIPMLLCRSGWSPERGYELFLKDSSRGDELWEKVMAVGQKYGIKPGGPNAIRRIEGGMLAFGNDITLKHNILELGLPPRWTYTDKADFMGKDAIKRSMDAGGPLQKLVGLELEACATEDRNIGPLFKAWDVVAVREEASQATLSRMKADVVGWVSSITFSPALGTHIAIATLATEKSESGTKVCIDTACGGRRFAVVRKLPFMPRAG